MPSTSLRQTNTQRSVASTPDWAMAPFREFLTQLDRQGSLMRLSCRGISVLRAMPQLAEAVANATLVVCEEDRQKVNLEDIEKEAKMAQREVDEGFPLLHAFAALSIWASLEATVRLFIVRWLENQPGALEVEEVQKLK